MHFMTSVKTITRTYPYSLHNTLTLSVNVSDEAIEKYKYVQ